jgi:uncharacterized protein (TIGR02145 family)
MGGGANIVRMKLLFFSMFFWLHFLPANGQEIIRDYDGNTYSSVRIRNQVWLTEDLKAVHFSNGDPIPLVTDPKQWDSLSSTAYCKMNNEPSNKHGLLYNWFAAIDSRNVCPDGWHVPSDDEWAQLTSVLLGENGRRGVLQESVELNQKIFWLLPVGFRGYEGEFFGLGYGGGGWWSSTESTSITAYYRDISYNTAGWQRMEGRKNYGYHIRCVKD